MIGDPPCIDGMAFPGCSAIRLRRSEFEAFDRRMEFWDADAEIAIVCYAPVSRHHEKPSCALAALVTWIAGIRGSPIDCYGHMGLLVRGDDGRPERAVQPDQTVYLHTRRAYLSGDVAMEVGVHDFPDVVLEVDHTTDVTKGKLFLYESWGFPELWVEVPDRPARSRPKGRASGLTIYLNDGVVFRESAESLAFPGWTTDEIHRAMNETVASEETYATLKRVGEALGSRDPGRAPARTTTRCSACNVVKPVWRAGRRVGRRVGSKVVPRRWLEWCARF